MRIREEGKVIREEKDGDDTDPTEKAVPAAKVRFGLGFFGREGATLGVLQRDSSRKWPLDICFIFHH